MLTSYSSCTLIVRLKKAQIIATLQISVRNRRFITTCNRLLRSGKNPFLIGPSASANPEASPIAGGNRRGGRDSRERRVRGSDENVGPTVESSQALIAAFEREPHTDEMPLRPGWGTNGKAISLQANFFALKLPSDLTIFDYEVSITPEWAFGIFKDAPPAILSYNPILRGGSFRLRPNAQVYTVQVKFLRALDTNEVNQYLQGLPSYRDRDISPFISALNVVLQQHASTTGVRVGQNRYFFPETERHGIALGLQTWKGFFLSVRPVYKQLMANVNVSATPSYAPGNLAILMAEWNQKNETMPKWFFDKLTIATTHLGYQRKHRIHRVMSTTARHTEFSCAEMGGMVSVERYFQQKYKIKLRYADTLPVIDVGANAPVYLPAEVCEIIPYQPFRGKLPAQASASMVKISTRSSASNANSIINDGLRLFGLQDHNPTLMNFGISVRKEMAIVPARVLPPPRILYQSGHLVVRQGGWNLIDVKFCAPGRIDNWVVLLVRDGRKEEFNGVDDPRLQDFLQMFLLQCQSSGISIGRGLPAIITTPPLPRANANRQDAVAVIAKALKDGLNNKQKPSVMLVLLPDKSLYTGLKRLCDVRLGIHTVCMFVKTARELKGRQRYFANVALKLNSKLGGINHSLDPQSMRWLTEKKTMTVGIDVTHPSSMSMKGMPSIAAVVANADDKFAQFPASLRLQTNRNVMKDGEEMVQDLTSMLVERLTLYKKNVGALPKRVIVYRDGVSESQYNLVNQKELPQILKAFETFNAGQKYRPSLSIVVCGKRHHARFPGTSAVHMTKNGNTLPGTVVDQGVTDIFNFDFYLQAHDGLQGTVRPSHYTIVYDENQLSADAIQTGIHHASYMYARATKAVSLVPPAYYADLACERARRYLAPLFDPDNAGSTLSTKGANGQEDSETGRRKVYDRAVQMWGNGVHQDLKDSMFYI